MSTNSWNSGLLSCLAFEKVAHYEDEELNLDYLQIVLLRRLLYDYAILNLTYNIILKIHSLTKVGSQFCNLGDKVMHL